MEILKVESREYVCPACGNLESHSTNHTGEIYCGCKKCGNGVLYYKDDSREFTPMFRVHKYYLNLEKIQDLQEYERICKQQEGVKLFNVHVSPRSSFLDKITENEIISVYQAESFENQFITNKGRLHTWFEAIYPNRRIKQGYYLTKITT